MRINIDELVGALHTLNGHGLKGASIEEFYVCSTPAARGQLTEEEYAPYLAAADLKHDTYMRDHRYPMPPGALDRQVTVNGTVVAWLQFDGVARVVERRFSDPAMNTVRDAARRYLGTDPKVQLRLTDERGDIEKMSATAFPGVIGTFLEHAAPGARFNDYPTDMPVRVYTQVAHDAARKATGKKWPFVPNPTRERTETERKVWAAEAERYTEAFRQRFPTEYRAWEFRNWWESTRADRATGPMLGLKGDDRILWEFTGELLPGVVALRMKEEGDTEIVDLLIKPNLFGSGDEGLMTWVKVYPGRAMRYEDVPQDVRSAFEETWAELLVRAQKKYSGPEFSRLR
ncbi:hypothetical protein [Streptomyces sp. NPDC086776]|uniref:hypothetical protein n=1 Tax=Streptomyces sp. NPDC086776 TaxID=3365756 RepID=UPI0038067A98